MTPRVNPSSGSDSDHANGIISCLDIEMSHRLVTQMENVVVMVTGPV